MKFCIWIL